ncbi:hypothetical protein BTO05_08570 [Winogradskyella sp. PC-19]|uniref:oligosaccharide flippase family protein n=1 Tax=Winogradskyella sp. PC-19 TaxID=754417 RepID=UPI000B558586|nr:oligosaccharide flippase family protein [Winogradskyella sp. PC-19]ARV09693.1 hypothetical protein BTO05_08570 [Winogradskyella sp. PC-19]
MLKNIIANALGRFWSILSNFLFIPLYIYFLGVESYSIISLTLVIVGLLAVLDSGLTATLSREFASSENSPEDKIKVFNTLETCYFAVAIIIMAIVFVSADFIANEWINLKDISEHKVSYYLKIISVSIGFEFLSKFYIGGMLGLEKQVRANTLLISWGILRNGAVVILLYFYQSLEVFFVWQTIITTIYVLILRFQILKLIGISKRDFFSLKIYKSVLKKVWKFASGMLLISLVAGLNSQMDKLAISNILSIENLGYYTAAVALTYSLVTITTTISAAILPRLTKLYTNNNRKKGALLFYRAYKYVIIIVFSFAFTIAFNSKSILWIWTQNKEIVNNAYHIVSIMSAAMAMLALAIIPFNIAIANGYTKLNNYIGIASLLITIPGYWIFANKYGAIGAASVFCAVQIIITLIYTHIINLKFLRLVSTQNIFLNFFIYPGLLITLITFGFKSIPVFFDSRLLQLLWLGIGVFVPLLISFYIFLTRTEKLIFYTKFRILKNKLPWI